MLVTCGRCPRRLVIQHNHGTLRGAAAHHPWLLRRPLSRVRAWARLFNLAARQGAEAAAEFQKILHHGGIVVGDPIGALAHLQLGRAQALSPDKKKAKKSYQDFLTLWKDADPDLPVLKQANAE